MTDITIDEETLSNNNISLELDEYITLCSVLLFLVPSSWYDSKHLTIHMRITKDCFGFYATNEC